MAHIYAISITFMVAFVANLLPAMVDIDFMEELEDLSARDICFLIVAVIAFSYFAVPFVMTCAKDLQLYYEDNLSPALEPVLEPLKRLLAAFGNVLHRFLDKIIAATDRLAGGRPETCYHARHCSCFEKLEAEIGSLDRNLEVVRDEGKHLKVLNRKLQEQLDVALLAEWEATRLTK